MSILPESIDEVRRSASLLEVAGEYTTFRSTGKNNVGLCPFHDEKTGSFSVNEESGLYYCFGCQAKGTVFDFVIAKKGLSFPEAVRYLADRFGVKLRETDGGGESSVAVREHRALLEEALSSAASFYEGQLWNGTAAKVAMEYLHSRGFKQESIRRFGLGFCPLGNLAMEDELVKNCSGKELLKSLSPDKRTSLLLELGVLSMWEKEGDQKRVYNPFRGRVIFPIRKTSGQVMAFGARLIGAGDRGPKYLNSCEHPLYRKKQTLYGLDLALSEIRKSDHLLLVEGYFDVIALHQAGVMNAVASCGTAVSKEHALVIKKLAKRVTLVFDGDEAGRKAAQRCFESFLNTGVDLRLVLLGEGQDPDSLAKDQGSVGLNALFKESRPLFPFVIERMLHAEAMGRTPSPTESGRVSERIAELLAQISNPVERECLISQAAQQLGASVQSLTHMVKLAAFHVVGKREQTQVASDVNSKLQNTRSPIISFPKSDVPKIRHISPGPQKARVDSGILSRLENFTHELVTTLLRDPSLSQSCLKVRFDAGEGEVALLDVLEEPVRNFISELALMEDLGADNLGTFVDEQELARALGPIYECLERHIANPQNYLKEIILHSRFHAAPVEKIREVLLDGASRVVALEELKRISMSAARAGEPDSEESPLDSVQKKLLARRAMEISLRRP